jgi:hypothetical protein
MQRRLSRVALVFVCAALGAGATASVADAATPPDTTLPASHVTSSSATLHATIFTGGVQTVWEFEYGRTTAYGSTTKAQVIPAGKTGATSVTFTVTGLKSGTTFHYRIATTFTLPPPYYFGTAVGGDLTFTTKPFPRGHLVLLSHNLTVRKGFTFIPIKCVGTKADLPCSGKLYVNATSHHHSVACSSHTFALRNGHRTTVKALTSKRCLALLARSSDLSIKATLIGHFAGGQKTLRTSVKLILRG